MLDETASGVFTIACTPFLPDGTLDEPSIDRMVDFYVEKGATGLTILGMMGEAGKLTAEESVTVVRRVCARTDLPVILCGDLNDIPQSYTYHLLNRRLQDTFRQKGSGLSTTYAGKIPGLRIDYVLVSPELAVRDFHTGRRSFSDHRPVWSKLQIPAR